MKKKKTCFKIILRLSVFIGLTFFVVAAVFSESAAKWLAGLSPFSFGAGAATRRTIIGGILFAVPPLAMLVLALFKGDVFCRWICPTGFLLRLRLRFSPEKQIIRTPLGGYILWAVVGASLIGTPFLLFLDPLSTFNRAIVAFRGDWSPGLLIPALMLPVLMILCFIQPMVWCMRLCPLGYLLRSIKLRKRNHSKTNNGHTRRQVIIGLCSGAAIAFLGKTVGISRTRGAATLIMPPGAGDSETFSSLCSRCFNCVNICPQNIIRMNTDARDGLARLFVPEINYDNGYCDELCSRCSNVCPTGALQPLDRAAKQEQKIGTAAVEHDRCYAWGLGQRCMICADTCPYEAIRSKPRADGLRRPVVVPETCRGCGRCELECPSGSDRKAIRVSGLHQQQTITKSRKNA